MIPIRQSAGVCSFAIRVRPRARQNQISGVVGAALKVTVTAPPAEGQANAACCRLLAKVLKLPYSSVSIAAGTSSRNKLVRVVGLTADELSARLLAAVDL